MVTVPDSASLHLTTAMTLEAWVYPTATSTDWSAIALKERGTTGLAYALYATDGAAKPPAGYVNVGGTDRNAAGASVLALNTWSHVAVTYGSSALKLYVNGVQAATRSQTGNISASTAPLRLGGDSIWGEYFTGLIDEVRVYNTALTQAQIQTDMNAPIGSGNPSDTTPPTVSVTAPADGSSVSGTVTVSATASDNVAVSGVQFLLDGANLGAEDTTSPYSISWDTSALSGSHTLSAVARDTSGNTATSAVVHVSVNNSDTTPPTVSITSPTDGATVSNTITVSANASDNVGVTGVQFFLDGNAPGNEDTSSPYSVSWDTTTAANGTHTLTARARDAANNATTSTSVSVTASNATDPSVIGQFGSVINMPTNPVTGTPI